MEQDTAIIELCQRGHPAGFTRLVAAYQERVYRTAYAFVHNREDALDITQEVFLRTVRAISSLDPARPLWPWLRRVTANLSINLIKRRHPHLSLDSLPEGALPADGSEPSWTMLDLQAAMAGLPPIVRMVLTLRHQEGLPYDEIARLTDLPVGTVKTHLFRGRRLLRDRLAIQEA
ncbi:MAG: RNA polymerase sigma factor [Bacillota bacterium]